MKKNRLTKAERSWILYDCANSAYSMAITSALFPIYFGFFGSTGTMDLGFFHSLASIFVAILSPILGTIADYKDRKKRFFLFFFLLGVIFTISLAAVSPDSGQRLLIALLYVVTAIGFAGANIFYDSFLVDTTTKDKMDRVSTMGFAYGYIASIIPFGISLLLILKLGQDNPVGFQLAFVITALWWGLFTIPLLRNVRQKYFIEREPNPVRNSFKRLGKTFKNIRSYKYVFIFLIAYFLYIDGVDTIIKMAVPYTQDVLGADLNMYLLLGMLFVVQIIAFPCAILYGRLAKRYSARKMIIVAIITYIISCTFAFFMTQTWHLLILGGLIGTAQGGIQALSRSFYAKIIPSKNSNEFFGFYNIFGKFAAILGPTLMAATAKLTGNARNSIFALVPLFLIGLIIFLRLPKDVTEREVIVTE